MIVKVRDWKVEDEEISLSDHTYITFVVDESNITIKRNVNNKRIAWTYSKFNLDLFHATFAWECSESRRIRYVWTLSTRSE